MVRGARKRWAAALVATALFTVAASGCAFAGPQEAPVRQPVGSLVDKETATSDDPLPLDITGDAAASEERDRLRALLAPLISTYGGMLWDDDRGVLTVRMTTEPALAEARAIIGDAATWLTTDFALVDYSEQELDALAERLLTHQESWAGAAGIGGGHYPLINRVVLEVDPDQEGAAALIEAIHALGDPRVVLELIEPIEDWAPEALSP